MSNEVMRKAEHLPRAPKPGASGFEIANWVMTSLGPLNSIAELFAKSGLVATALQGKPGAVLKVLMRGLELGIPMATALDTIHVINGRVCLSADDMAGLAMKGGTTFVYDSDDTRCIVEWRRGESRGRTSFSVADANLAGLTANPNWKKYPAAMCCARAKAAAARQAAPDMLAGIYTPEEIKATDRAVQEVEYEVVNGDAQINGGSGSASASKEIAAGAGPGPAPIVTAQAPEPVKPKVVLHRTVATAPEIAEEQDGARKAAAASLWAIVGEIGIGVKGNGKDTPSRITIAQPELRGAVVLAGLGDKLQKSLVSGGGELLVPRDLSIDEWNRLAHHLRDVKRKWDAEKQDEETAMDAEDMLGANPADPAE